MCFLKACQRNSRTFEGWLGFKDFQGLYSYNQVNCAQTFQLWDLCYSEEISSQLSDHSFPAAVLDSACKTGSALTKSQTSPLHTSHKSLLCFGS